MTRNECQSLVGAQEATVVVVSYRTAAIALTWVPDHVSVVIVHNDLSLAADSVTHPGVIHIGDGVNIGFGPGVNTALAHVSTSRVVLVNPDTILTAEHWEALSVGGCTDLVVVPLVDAEGIPTSMVNRYPTAASLLLTAMRAGRLFGRDSAVRRALLPMMGHWGRQHRDSLTATPHARSWPASTYWHCAAACSYPTALVRKVGGFDPGYFLYLEDVDLVRRMAVAEPGLRVVQPGVAPGVHQVAASSRGPEGRRIADLQQARSAERYAKSQSGPTWWAVAFVIAALGRSRARALRR